MVFDFKREMNDYFADEFAKDESKWMPVANYFATVYMKNFYKNLEFMSKELQKGINNKLTPDEDRRLAIVVKNAFLQTCIDDNSESYILNIGKIKKIFVPMTKEEGRIKENDLKSIDKESKKFNNSKFSDLDHMADFLLSFINIEGFRKEYYAKISSNGEINKDLLNKSMINAKITSTFVSDARRIAKA